ncbi:hypothetical protein [Caballeronia sp. S22]
MRLLRYYDVEIEDKRAIIVGRSRILGTPMAMDAVECRRDSHAMSFTHR